MTIPAGHGEIRWFFSGSGAPSGAEVTLGFQSTGSGSASTLAQNAYGHWQNNILDNMVQNVGLVRCEVKIGPDETGPTGEYSGTFSGTIITPQSPPQVAFLVTKQTALGGRRGRGRFFIPGVAEADVDQAGGVSTTRLTALNTDLATLMTNLTSSGMTPMLLHGPSTVWELINGQPVRVPVGTAPAPTIITAMVCSSFVGTQRRRLRR